MHRLAFLDRYWEDSDRVFRVAKLADHGVSAGSPQHNPRSPSSHNEHEPTCST